MTPKIPITTQLARSFALIALLAGGLAVTAFSDAGTSRRSMSKANSTQPNSLLQQALNSENGFGLTEGHWQFPGMHWTILQSEPQPERDVPDVEVPETISSDVVELDNHMLGLVKSLMTVASTEGNIRRYYLQSEELRGTAVTVLKGDLEIPVSLCFRWPAYDNLWTRVEARRRPDHQETQPLLLLPPGTEIVATRVTTGGSTQCHMIFSALSGTSLRNQFAADGWVVELPPEEAGMSGLFWISSAAGRFEVSHRDAVGSSGSTAIIRRI